MIHILSHWTEVENVYLKTKGEGVSFYYDLVTNLTSFSFEAARSSLANLLEVVNFAIFVGKRSVFYVKSKTYYEQYVQHNMQHDMQQLHEQE